MGNKEKKNSKSWHRFFIIQVLIIIFAFISIKSSLFISQDMFFRSYMMKFRSNIVKNFFSERYKSNLDKILVVWVDPKFFVNENIAYQWLHRWYYARALENLDKYNPSSIVMDVFFEKWYQFSGDDKKTDVLNKIFESYDKSLTNAITNKTILASIFDSETNKVKEPDKIFQVNKPILWHAHYYDPFSKNLFLWIQNNISDTGVSLYPLSIEAFANYEVGILNQSISWYQYEYNIKSDENNIHINIAWKETNIPLVREGLQDKNYIFTPLYFNNETLTWVQKQVNFISLYDVYKGNIDKEKVKDKIVLIGATDRMSIYDIRNTLVGEMPWILIHANQILALLNHDYIYSISPTQSFIIIFCLMFLNLFIINFFIRNRNYAYIFSLLSIETILILAITVYLCIAWLFWNSFFPNSIFVPIWTILIILFAHMLTNLAYTIRDFYWLKNNIQKLFNIYTWENLFEKNVENSVFVGKRTSKERDVAIMFCDIVWYTKISENLSPKQSTDLLNIFLEDSTNIILENKWFIDKYMWDGFMAFWEDRNTCNLAAKSTIQIIKELSSINEKVRNIIKSDKKDIIDIRIGLHFGKVIIWDIGSEKKRLNHTIIWDNVNLASRLEWINKFYWSRVCISSDLWNNIKNKEEFVVRRLDKIKVKWKENPVEILELFGIDKSYITTENNLYISSFIKFFEKGLDSYFAGDFDEAVKMFNEAKNVKDDKTCDIFIQRCNFLKISSAWKWDGIWTFLDK